MDNNFLHLELFENKDIEQYLRLSFAHLNHIITNLELLSDNACEKEHVIDILNECVYIKEDLIKSVHNYQQYENEETFTKIQSYIQTIYSIEEELISDYPDLFSNNDCQWYIYIKNTHNEITCCPVLTTAEKKSSKKHMTRWAFGFFFLFPTFLFIIFYPLVYRSLYKIEEYPHKQYVFEYDRAYKNIYYLYTAVITNKSADNFYSLMKSNSFQLPEGFVILDKNLIVDYYLKEYYSLVQTDDENALTVISVSNLNFRQCKYVLTKFAGINIEKIISNEKEIIFDEKFTPESYCNSQKNTNNLISLYIKNN